ncbi:transmembrane protein 18-domain-containing protein [Zychaea mexicana]|uniref:transmembrane protein 18-domain-containing protein n=1 Tax=Zychaea mexicana TaxID=64656 RepID=UPI0022FF4059|nr:transmembrane protein 18-domain-containing protein [Zychaea mexicana]KAI9490546.1 transmembrane protein 18-domain-containing protein [Zychaea mexicana]
MSATQGDFIKHILSSVHAKQNSPGGSVIDQYIERTYEFLDAIDWSQKWLQGLIGFHVICFATTLLLRNHSTGLSVYFFVLLGMAALVKPLNGLCKTHWEEFASADYFDESGLFIVSVYALPLVFNAFVTLIFILKTAAGLLVSMKRAQIRQQQQKRRSDKQNKKDE